jgi:hypothetical protein
MIDAQQAMLINNYKNTKYKLLQCTQYEIRPEDGVYNTPKQVGEMRWK